MGFLPGEGGRPKGTLNKRTYEFRAILEKRGFCPATALMECYEEARKTYDNYGTIYEAIVDARIVQNDKDGSCVTPLEDNAHKYLKIAADIAKDIASYSFPKLKAIEQTKPNPFEGMSPAQKLETAREFVKILEIEVQSGTASS